MYTNVSAYVNVYVGTQIHTNICMGYKCACAYMSMCKVHRLTSAYPCDICMHAHIQDSGFCGSALVLVPVLRKCGVRSQMVETPKEIMAPYLPAKSPNQALSFSTPQNGSVQIFLFKLAKPYLLSLGHIFYFSIYMVIFLNFASYRNVQTCMKVENPPDWPCASITKDPALPVSALQFSPLLPVKHVRGRIPKFEHSILIRRPRVDPRRSSTNQKAKPAISQAVFWVLSANADSNVH